MSLVLNVEILGEFKNLTAATKGAQSQLTAMNKRASSVSRGITKAFAAIGIGFSLGVIKRELEEAAKAAVEDTKSMTLLATAMENTGKASAVQVAEAEKAIKSMQLQSAVADDDLRPAYQKLFIATGSVTESNRLMKIALDASAATGKSLDAVSQAMAKSLAGSDTALVKLIPSIKGATDPMATLEATFAGAAEAAANTDPYQRMQIIFGEMQEQIGMALLPLLNEFSTWLATPEGQEKLQGIVDFIVLILQEFGKLVAYIIENKDWLVPVVAALGGLAIAWQGVTIAIGVARTAQTLFAAEAIAKAGAAMAAWAPLAALLGVAAVSAWAGETLQTDTAASQKTIGGAFGINSTAAPSAGGSNMTFTAPKTNTKATNVVNVNVKTVTDAKQVIKTVSQFQQATGTTLAQALR
jgi:hypothetical protein